MPCAIWLMTVVYKYLFMYPEDRLELTTYGAKQPLPKQAEDVFLSFHHSANHHTLLPRPSFLARLGRTPIMDSSLRPSTIVMSIKWKWRKNAQKLQMSCYTPHPSKTCFLPRNLQSVFAKTVKYDIFHETVETRWFRSSWKKSFWPHFAREDHNFCR